MILSSSLDTAVVALAVDLKKLPHSYSYSVYTS